MHVLGVVTRHESQNMDNCREPHNVSTLVDSQHKVWSKIIGISAKKVAKMRQAETALAVSCQAQWP